MQIEYEASFSNINADEIRQKLKELSGKRIKPEFLQKRMTFHLPKGHEIEGGFLRVRDEADKITFTLKIMKSDGSIEGQKELELNVDSYETAIDLLKMIGATEKAVQESRRELWELNGVEIMIDWWPFLEPIIEIEGPDEASVKEVAEALGFDWGEAIFDSIDYVYCETYNLPKESMNNTPKVVFDMENPFLG